MFLSDAELASSCRLMPVPISCRSRMQVAVIVVPCHRSMFNSTVEEPVETEQCRNWTSLSVASRPTVGQYDDRMSAAWSVGIYNAIIKSAQEINEQIATDWLFFDCTLMIYLIFSFSPHLPSVIEPSNAYCLLWTKQKHHKSYHYQRKVVKSFDDNIYFTWISWYLLGLLVSFIYRLIVRLCSSRCGKKRSAANTRK